MKKITLIIVFLISILGFSQNLVSNGDFQTGTAAPWYGNAANPVDMGSGNFANEANVLAAGNPWDVNLSQEILLENGKTYKLTFDAFTDSATGTRTIISGLGQTGAPYSSLTSTTTLTSTLQTFTYQITINYGDTVTDRVIFDMGAATGFVFIDNVSVVEVLPLIQNFETPNTYNALASFSGAAASVVADPASGGINGQVLSGTQGPGGDVWQGIEFVQTAKKAKLTTNKTMTVDVYCSQAFNLLAKVDQGGTAPASATGQAYTTPGQWQTLTFNFAVPMDNTAVANGEYQKIIFFGNWNSTNDGWNSPIVPLTFYIDNVRSEEVIIAPASLPLIQNFETPNTYNSLASFNGTSASVVADPASGGTNGQVLSGTQGPGGDVWQGIEFVQTAKKAKLTTNKTMTVDVYCSQAFNLLAKVDQGGTAPASATGQAYTTPGQWQTLTFNFAVPMDNTAVANGEYQKIIFFGNWKATNDGFNSPIVPLTFYIDNVRSEEAPVVIVSDPAPLDAAPTPPARNAWDVISLFSNAYSNITINDWSAGIGWNGGAPITDLQIVGNDTKKIAFGDFIGVDFGAGHHIDATDMTTFHMDFWIPSTTDLIGKVLNPKFSAWTSDTSGQTSSFLLTYLPTVNGTWASIDAPISSFTAGGSDPNTRNNVAQFLISSNLGLVYVDNIYLYRPATMTTDTFNTSNVRLYPNPTSTNLTIEAKDAIESVTIYNVLGQQVISKNPMSNSMTMDVSNLENGLYFVNCTIDGKSSTTKFIKN